MSYDIVLFPVAAGEDVAMVFARRAQAESEEVNPGPMVDAAEVAKKRISDALQEQLPTLRLFPFAYDLIAHGLGTDTAEAQRRWRHIELNEEHLAFQVSIHDRHVDIALSYWQKGRAAEDAFGKMWTCLSVIQDHSGYVAYDKQLEREIIGASSPDRSPPANHRGRSRC